MTSRSLLPAADETTPDVAFEPEFIARVRHMFEEEVLFNKTLGLTLTGFRPEEVTASIRMRPALVGNFAHNRMHGGVTSSCLDVAGGFAVMAAVFARHMDEPMAERLKRFGKLGTIDLRIDYLRPVQGERFDIAARVLRLGSRVANTVMEFRGADGKLLSTGAAAYIVS